MPTFRRIVALAFWLATYSAGAQTVTVFSCTDAHQGASPSDLTLATALSQATRILLACPADTQLRISIPLAITRPVEIDGGGTASLLQDTPAGLFIGTAGGRLVLSNLTLVTSGNVHAMSSSKPSISGQIDVEMRNVTVIRLRAAIKVDANNVSIAESRFLTSGGGDVTVVEAKNITVRHSEIANTERGVLFNVAAGQLILDAVRVTGGYAGSRCLNGGRVVVSNSSFVNVNGIASGRLGGVLSSECETLIEHSSFEQNTAQSGGALYFHEPATVDIRSSIFAKNRAQADGGAIAFEQPAGTYRARLQYLRLYDNEAGRGGALSIGGSFLSPGEVVVDARGLTFKHNHAVNVGGAVYIGSARIQADRLILLSNEGRQGGAIFVDETVKLATVANAIVAGNVASEGAAVEGHRLRLLNSTVYANGRLGLLARGDIQIANTIIAGHDEANCRALTGASLQTLGNSLQYPGGSCGSAVAIGDPALDTFFVPASASPATGTADLSICRAAPVDGHDVYGQRRPRGSGCSIGAVEGSIEQIANARRLSAAQHR